MSSEDFAKSIEECKKKLSVLRKDINEREDQEKRGQTTYELDAEIRGQFIQIGDLLDSLAKMLKNYASAPKQFNLSKVELERRQKLYDQNVNERNLQQKIYDGFFIKKAKTADLMGGASAKQTFEAKYDTKNMTAKDHLDLKLKQQRQQDEAINDLIGVVKNIKEGGKQMSGELDEQDKMLNRLDEGLDNNTEKMSKTRRNIMKLLESSSNCCLIVVLLIEIISVVLILVLWP